MSGHNRHLRGDINEILAPVRGKTVIEAGDFVYAHTGDSNYVYPVSDFKDSSTTGRSGSDVSKGFQGVAMEGSPSGVTENIVVATAGVFRYPLLYKSAVTIGAVVSMVSCTAGSGATAQKVINSEAQDAGGTTVRYGVIVKTETSAVSFVDFALRTMYSGATASIQS